MEYPKIKFSLNKSLDKRMAMEFLGYNYRGGINFAQSILGPHPGIKKSIFSYVDNFYKQHQSQLLKIAVDFQKFWNKKSGKFFTATNAIFNHHPWPKGKYIGYISIFSCGPRFLYNKTFQVFYRNDELNAVFCTAHENLHFLFYDYVEKKRGDIKKKLNDDKLWRVSEIVNEVLLYPDYLGGAIGLRKKLPGYPEFVPIAEKIKKFFKKTDDIDKLIELAIKFDK